MAVYIVDDDGFTFLIQREKQEDPESDMLLIAFVCSKLLLLISREQN